VTCRVDYPNLNDTCVNTRKPPTVTWRHLTARTSHCKTT